MPTLTFRFFMLGECDSDEGENMRLKELLLATLEIDVKHDCTITGLAIDSRLVKPGDLFFAYKGFSHDGRDFIEDAIKNGAVAVLCSDELPKDLAVTEDLPIVVVADLQDRIGEIAAKFYGYPARNLTMIGVTGTNGKTSVVQYIATSLTDLGINCGIIGTLGIGFPGKLIQALNTTPDPVAIQKWLFDLSKDGAKAVAMEISSHGLIQGRLNSLDFNIGIFTNLTHEHLDYHITMEDYGKAKKKLFLEHNLQYAVINGDDEFGRELINDLKDKLNVYAYTIEDKVFADIPVIKAKNIGLQAKLTSADIVSPWGDGLLKTKLLGRFNISNLLAAFVTLGLMKVDVVDILKSFSALNAADGRMQVFGGEHKKPLVVIDFAHTPDALEKALVNLRDYCRGSLWCVFGCGGDRDRSKRSFMGKVVERYSDHMVITNDNPRTEDPKKIIDDILSGLLCPWAAEVENDRMAAIEYAISHANSDDLILVAGKGHEDYQIIGKDKMPFSDKEVVERALNIVSS
jgi:UDP-N-acetylmuramoyl-L-alanyl-D-glutamate--2,6-diaminopimelate ligase